MNLRKANIARADTIRFINRQIVLNYVREKEPISRAEISHETALQRSTVSLIVEELKSQGLIDEIEGGGPGEDAGRQGDHPQPPGCNGPGFAAPHGRRHIEFRLLQIARHSACIDLRA